MAIRPIVLNFIVKGIPDVSRALRNVSDVLASAEKQATVAARREASARIKEAEREVEAKMAAYARASRLASRAMAAAPRSVAMAMGADARVASGAVRGSVASLARAQNDERQARAKQLRGKIGESGIGGLYGPDADAKAANAKQKAEEKAAREKVKVWLAADRELAKAREQGAKEAARLAREQAREEASIEREKNREALRWVREREREEASEKKRLARANQRELQETLGFRSTISGAAGSAVRSTLGIGQRIAGAMMGLGGGFSLEDSLSHEVALRGQAATIVSSADTKMTSGELLSNAKKVALDQGLDTSEVLSGYDEIKKLSGNMDMAQKLMPQLAKVATATGSNLGELGGLAGNILATNDNISADDLMRQVRLFTQQGIVGGVEIGDFAKYGGRITAGAGLFGGNRSQNEATLGAFAQIARQKGGASSAAEAAMGAQRFATDVAGHSKMLEKQGIKVSDGHGKLRDPREILLDMLTHTGGDITKFKSVGLNERGIKPLTGAADIYNEARRAKEAELAKSGSKLTGPARAKALDEAGRSAVTKALNKFSNRDEKGNEVLNQSAIEAKEKQRLAEVDMQVKRAMEELRQKVGAELVPHLTRLMPLMGQLIPRFAQLLDGVLRIATWAENNPFGGFAALVGGFFLKELAAAKIADTIQSMIRGGKVPTPTPGGGAGGGGGGVATTAVGVGLAAAAVTANAMLGYEGGVDQAQDIRAKVNAYMRGDHERGISPEKAQEMVAQAKGRLESHGGVLEQTANLLTSPFVDASNKDYKQYKSDQGLTESKEGQQLQRELIDALKQNTQATKDNSKSGGGGPPGAGGFPSLADPNAPGRGTSPLQSSGRP